MLFKILGKGNAGHYRTDYDHRNALPYVKNRRETTDTFQESYAGSKSFTEN